MATQTALYRFYDSEHQLLYVGISKNWPMRFENHFVNKKWISEVINIKIEWLRSRGLAEMMERAAIRWEKPKYNKSGIVDNLKNYNHYLDVVTNQQPMNDAFHRQLQDNFDKNVASELDFVIRTEVPTNSLFEWAFSNAAYELSSDSEEVVLKCKTCTDLATSQWVAEGNFIYCELWKGEQR